MCSSDLSGRDEGDPAWVLWRMPGPAPVAVCPRAHGPAFGVAWSPDSQQFAVGLNTGDVELVPVDQRSPSTRIPGHGTATSVRFLDHNTLAYANDANLVLWDRSHHALLGEVPNPWSSEGINDLAWTGSALYASRDGPSVRRINFDAPTPPVRDLGETSLSPDRKSTRLNSSH